jgi:hypothetical protein
MGGKTVGRKKLAPLVSRPDLGNPKWVPDLGDQRLAALTPCSHRAHIGEYMLGGLTAAEELCSPVKVIVDLKSVSARLECSLDVVGNPGPVLVGHWLRGWLGFPRPSLSP